MRIAILVKEFPPDVIGGAEIQTMFFARELTARGHDVTVYTKSYPGEESHDSDFDLVRCPTWHLNPFISTLIFLLSASLLLLRDHNEYDILQCIMVYPNGFVGYVVNKLTGLPYFGWIRGGDFYFMKDNGIKRWMMKKVVNDTIVVTNSDNVGEDVRGVFPQARLRTVNPAVYLPDEPSNGDDIVFVGRLKAQKGVDRLLKASRAFDRTVLIVGDGPERDSLETLADRFDIDADFVGEVNPSEVQEYLQRGAVFVLPSVRGEGGSPNAMLEALASGIPVIVTSTGGLINAVRERDFGFEIEPDDSDAIRARLETLLSDEQRRVQMGQNGRKYVQETHSFDVILDKLEGIYQEVLADHGVDREEPPN